MVHRSSIQFAAFFVAFAASILIATKSADAIDPTAVQEKILIGDFDGALKSIEPSLLDDNLLGRERGRELAARVLHLRGEERFRHARIVEAIADFDRELELQPNSAPYHWQRGIACYYAKEYEKGAKLFDLHQTVNPQDVENAAWHFLCFARTPKGSFEIAESKLLPVSRDPRVSMAQIHEMFAGNCPPKEVLRLGAAAGGLESFYADLYVSLYYESFGQGAESLRLMKQAAENPAAKYSYMGNVARVHMMLREREPKP